MSKVTIAIEGCCHGELDNIYSTLMHLQQVEGKKIDLLICCGDFQAVRNMDDLETMACPAKYRSLQSFHKYYSGEAVAPIPTLFIGGNHEASNYLWELYHGGWAAPNIYFLGFAGCVKFGGIRIAGLSGIYKQGDYYKGHDERLPYTDGSMRSMYHIRDFEVNRLMQITEPVDIMLSHDWPRNIAKHGNTAALISRKPFLKEEIETETLGSAPGEQLLHTLQPSYWFSAHLHTKFAAVVQHPGGDLTTKFLALDKCLPGRDFLQVIELDSQCEGAPCFEYDREWLAIMRSTHETINLRSRHVPIPIPSSSSSRGPLPSDLEAVDKSMSERGNLRIPDNFVQTVPRHTDQCQHEMGGGGRGGGRGRGGFQVQPRRGRMPQGPHIRNPQTVQLLDMIGLRYNLDHSELPQGGHPQGGIPQGGHQHQGGFYTQQQDILSRGPFPPPPPRNVTDDQVKDALSNPEEIDLEDDDEEEDKELKKDPMFQAL